jgi:hypothetical protein
MLKFNVLLPMTEIAFEQFLCYITNAKQSCPSNY